MINRVLKRLLVMIVLLLAAVPSIATESGDFCLGSFKPSPDEIKARQLCKDVSKASGTFLRSVISSSAFLDLFTSRRLQMACGKGVVDMASEILPTVSKTLGSLAPWVRAGADPFYLNQQLADPDSEINRQVQFLEKGVPRLFPLMKEEIVETVSKRYPEFVCLPVSEQAEAICHFASAALLTLVPVAGQLSKGGQAVKWTADAQKALNAAIDTERLALPAASLRMLPGAVDFVSTAAISLKNTDPQLALWNEDRFGNLAAAKRFERELRHRLMTAKVSKSVAVGIGAQGATRVTFEEGAGGEIEAIWKPFRARHYNEFGILLAPDDSAAETSVYELDRFLGFHSVPITVDRELHGVKGTAQLAVKSLRTDRVPSRSNPRSPLLFFDELIANFDRRAPNYLYPEGGGVAAIDHGKALSAIDEPMEFTASVKKAIVCGTPCAGNVSAIMPSLKVFERLKAMTESQAIAILGPRRTPAEVQAFLGRRKRVIATIEQAKNVFGDGIFSAGPFFPVIGP